MARSSSSSYGLPTAPEGAAASASQAGFERPRRRSHHGLHVGIASDALPRAPEGEPPPLPHKPGLTGRGGEATTASISASQAMPCRGRLKESHRLFLTSRV